MLLSYLTAVVTGISNYSSIAPRSPRRPAIPFNKPLFWASVRAYNTLLLPYLSFALDSI